MCLIGGAFGDGLREVLVQFVVQEIAVRPHRAGEGMIFPIAERSRRTASEVWIQAEANGAAIDFDPEMTARCARSPAQEDERVVFLEGAASLEGGAIQCFQHVGEAAFAQDTFRILAHRLPPGLVSFFTQNGVYGLFVGVHS